MENLTFRITNMMMELSNEIRECILQAGHTVIWREHVLASWRDSCSTVPTRKSPVGMWRMHSNKVTPMTTGSARSLESLVHTYLLAKVIAITASL